jgi:hypothetical protein
LWGKRLQVAHRLVDISRHDLPYAGEPQLPSHRAIYHQDPVARPHGRSKESHFSRLALSKHAGILILQSGVWKGLNAFLVDEIYHRPPGLGNERLSSSQDDTRHAPDAMLGAHVFVETQKMGIGQQDSLSQAIRDGPRSVKVLLRDRAHQILE